MSGVWSRSASTNYEKWAQYVCREREEALDLAVAGRHERGTAFMSTITANLADFCPHLLDALHDAQRHVEVTGNFRAVFAQCVCLVNDALLEIFGVVVSNRCGGFFTRRGCRNKEAAE